MSLLEGSDRPRNSLLRHLSQSDYALIAPHIEVSSLAANEILYNPGDHVETVYFPCDGSVACFVVVVEDGQEVLVELVGREGAVGGIVSQGRLPAYSRITVRSGGPFVSLPIARLHVAKAKSGTFADVFARYADCLLAQFLQTSACNAAHSIEQRAAKWILAAVDRAERDVVPLSHERLASMLGVGRSYVSRVIQTFRAQGIIETRRLEFQVLDRVALQSKSCRCDETVRAHFGELLRGVYPLSETQTRT